MQTRINFDKVNKQLKQIDGDITKLEKEITSLKQMQQEVRLYWKGEASDIYVRKLEALIYEIESTKKQMRYLADSVRNIADSMKREDEEMARKATQLH